VAVPHDAVLLIAFGGPTRPQEVRPFLDNVLRGRPIPPERYEEVVRHYEAVGGASPINRLTFEQAEALKRLLEREGPALPVYVGMRFWVPAIADTLACMAREGRRRAAAIVLAPHPSPASWDAYLQAVAEAGRRLGAEAPAIEFAAPWCDHPLFIEAIAARVREAIDRVPAERRAAAALIFTAHSIPVAMSEVSGYAARLTRTAELAGRALGAPSWTIAYQSRSGGPPERWLEPDIAAALRERRSAGARDAVVAPIGFVSDHVEVLYDLDVAARAAAEAAGLGFFRASTVGDHPSFVGMLAALVRDVIAGRAA
jgi:ferrochelatase